MTISTDTAAGDERLELLDGLIYSDAFDCALTLDELWRYSRIAVGRDALARRLRDDPVLCEVVTENGGLYCLTGRRELTELRPQQITRAHVLQRRAQRVASVLRVVPFVRGLVLTGSAAADDAVEGADVDVLVLVAPNRLGLVFAVLGSASRLLGRRLFCPNYYVCENHLGIEPPNIYVARELAQARCLVGDARTLREANPWLLEMFPNAEWATSPRRGSRARPALQRLLEAPLRGSLGNRIERAARRLAVARLESHHRALGETVPADVRADFEAGIALRFHRGHVDEITLERYTERRSEIAAKLARADPQLVRQPDESVRAYPAAPPPTP